MSHLFLDIIIDKPCWKEPLSHWEGLLLPAALETLVQAGWVHPVEINILMTDAAEVKTLNAAHRGFEKPTNVLSFPSLEVDKLSELFDQPKLDTPIFLGDIALSFETILDEAIIQEKPFDHHLIHLIVHGILHLLGFDHENDEDAEEMENLEIKILHLLTIPNPY